ncbi:hypothetical protein CDD83_6292 [Cordyceps sp. RAO-2017]|nr:hypothetical protein CDD83_6292 [Cordyceps sp. RAO-2017]
MHTLSCATSIVRPAATSRELGLAATTTGGGSDPWGMRRRRPHHQRLPLPSCAKRRRPSLAVAGDDDGDDDEAIPRKTLVLPVRSSVPIFLEAAAVWVRPHSAPRHCAHPPSGLSSAYSPPCCAGSVGGQQRTCSGSPLRHDVKLSLAPPVWQRAARRPGMRRALCARFASSPFRAPSPRLPRNFFTFFCFALESLSPLSPAP